MLNFLWCSWILGKYKASDIAKADEDEGDVRGNFAICLLLCSLSVGVLKEPFLVDSAINTFGKFLIPLNHCDEVRKAEQLKFRVEYLFISVMVEVINSVSATLRP